MLDFVLYRCYIRTMVMLNLRLPEELHKALKEIAEKERRSLNSQILIILELYVKQLREKNNSQA